MNVLPPGLARAPITLWTSTCATVDGDPDVADTEIALPTTPGRSSNSPIAPATPARAESRRVTPAAGR